MSGAGRVAGALLAATVVATLAAVGLTAGTASAAAGCSINIIAHPDDDLFFINPATLQNVQSTGCVSTVYVTSGDAGSGTGYSQRREEGVRAAYAKMANTANSWTKTTVTIAGKVVNKSTLAGKPSLALYFLRLPDGNIDGSGTGASGYTSLQDLYGGSIASLRTVDAPIQDYTRAQLISTLGSLITTSGAATVRTLDERGAYGDGDHSDHYTVARFAVAAKNAAAPSIPVVGYLGYPGSDLPANVSGADLTNKQNAFLAYAPYDSQMCQSLAACNARPEGTWLPRQHLSSELHPTDPGQTGNAALTATATASSQNANDGQTAAKAIDGVVDGYPGVASREWATQAGKAGSWLQLNWLEPVQLGSVVLFDRPNTSDQVTAATVSFSDGTSVTVPSLDNAGAGKIVTFAPRTTTTLRVTITSVSASTSNVGLAELQAWTAGSGPSNPTTPPTTTPPTTTPPTTTPPTTTPPTTTPPTTTPPATPNLATTSTVTASSENPNDGQTAVKVKDGVIDGYPGVATAEWATQGGKAGSWVQLTWPTAQTVDRVVLYDRLNTSDQVTAGTLTFSNGTTVAVPTLSNAGAGVTVTFPSRSTTSVRLTITGVSASTSNVGLAEFQAYGGGSTTPTTTAPTTTAPTTTAPTTTAPTTTAPTTTAPTTTAPTTTAPTTTPPTTTPPTTTAPTTTAPTTTPPAAAVNQARTATVSASSQNTNGGQPATKAIDNVIAGYPTNAAAEWATVGGVAGSWIQLAWSSPVTLSRVVLYDRPNLDDQVTAATITFSNGSTVTVPVLDNAGGPVTVTFTARSTTTLRVTFTTVSGTTRNVGLAELQAWTA
ncbi:DUF7402 domain-containing protein [Modestobacter italicus]|uniref:DUF7402 domain-containing protein n=1 Tax=Modestobacter italicus (strain DSM 44449 / CECT 9708 / BC 501) TaxID=2732864 RepID=UPI001412F3A7|nr:discoidin domain-containing protein [Modestobacter marinus]